MTQAILEQCKRLVEGDIPVAEFTAWMQEHDAQLQAALAQEDYLVLRSRPFFGAARLLTAAGVPFELGDQLCRECGERLFEVIPGVTTQGQMRAFSQRAHWMDASQRGSMLTGRFCPNGCTREYAPVFLADPGAAASAAATIERLLVAWTQGEQSIWGDERCSWCGAPKKTWADASTGTCAICDHPLRPPSAPK